MCFCGTVYYGRVSDQSRHNKRAAGKTQTSVSMRSDLLEQARAAAEAEGRTLSNWIEQMLREKFEAGGGDLPKPKIRGE